MPEPTEAPAVATAPPAAPSGHPLRSAYRPGARRARPSVLAVIAVGGVTGTLGRYGVGLLVPVAPGRFPWATFVVNMTGAFGLGLLLVALVGLGRGHGHLRAFAATGVLGAYTTFSTLVVETVRLVDVGHAGLGAAYLGASLSAGVLAAAAGMASGRVLVRSCRRRWAR